MPCPPEDAELTVRKPPLKEGKGRRPDLVSPEKKAKRGKKDGGKDLTVGEGRGGHYPDVGGGGRGAYRGGAKRRRKARLKSKEKLRWKSG